LVKYIVLSLERSPKKIVSALLAERCARSLCLSHSLVSTHVSNTVTHRESADAAAAAVYATQLRADMQAKGGTARTPDPAAAAAAADGGTASERPPPLSPAAAAAALAAASSLLSPVSAAAGPAPGTPYTPQSLPSPYNTTPSPARRLRVVPDAFDITRAVDPFAFLMHLQNCTNNSLSIEGGCRGVCLDECRFSPAYEQISIRSVWVHCWNRSCRYLGLASSTFARSPMKGACALSTNQLWSSYRCNRLATCLINTATHRSVPVTQFIDVDRLYTSAQPLLRDLKQAKGEIGIILGARLRRVCVRWFDECAVL
jgi:hypothetical protein